MSVEAPQKLKLPRLRNVRLRRFSLFSANPNAEFSCDDGVLCLVGANGIGKSTLLSAINFCLTGIVSDPNRAFESMDEYYKFTRAYSSSYFRGRIVGSDEDDSEISLSFGIGEFEYELTRGLFEPQELRGLTIRDGTKQSIAVGTDKLSRVERHNLYVDSVVKHTGLASFVEFVFLQHFVFTFDEQRKTLFWNPRIMERVLYRAFGMDPDMAKQADTIRREIQHEDSRVRNYQWESTRMRKRINEIRSQTQAASGAQQQYDSLITDHEALSRQFEEDSKILNELQDALKDANVRLAEQSVRESALRDEYSRYFDKRFNSRPPLARHPLIVQSQTEHACALCGNTTDEAQSQVGASASGDTCPLCKSSVNQVPLSVEHSNRLQELDLQLGKVKQTIRDSHKELAGISTEEAKARQQWETTRRTLDDFDRQNSNTLEGLRQLLSHNIGASSLSDYRQQLSILDKDKETAYQRREDLKSQLLRLQRDLEQHYLQVEQTFVPSFAEFAHKFLGMPLSVQMETKDTEDVKLVVSVRGTTRRLQQNLSESQRFFLDIALRMALTQHMSDPAAPGGIFIDTPEGSLDIAYEKRAGEMLAMFAARGHQIIMTANLNSSKLLLALARHTGRAHMKLCRMTDWAELSEVQQEEEQLFDEAYKELDEAMGS